MKKYDVVIIGASAAGAVAASTARKFYPEKSICVIREFEQVPIPCGIPYIYGTIGDPMKNLIPVGTMFPNQKIDSIVDTVESIDTEHQFVHGKHEDVEYDRLILATGSLPIEPPIKGASLINVFAIHKNTPYLQKLLDQVKTSEKIVIIGGGFIGVEMAEELKKNNPLHEVTIIEMQDRCLNLVYDKDFCELAEKELLEQGIHILRQRRVMEIIGNDHVEGILLENGDVIDADMVILGIGSKANSQLAKQANLKIGHTGGIIVDHYMQTSNTSIFACGDCAEKTSFFDKTPSSLRLASIATMEARIAGSNLFKKQRINHGVVGCFSTALHGKAFASAGLTSDEAIRKGYQIVVGDAESVNRHPGIMPGSAPMKIRLIFEKSEGVIVGGQIFGALSGGELINAISAFISKKMTADDIALFQAGTHPALTASPIAYQLVNAAENASIKLRN